MAGHVEWSNVEAAFHQQMKGPQFDRNFGMIDFRAPGTPGAAQRDRRCVMREGSAAEEIVAKLRDVQGLEEAGQSTAEASRSVRVVEGWVLKTWMD